MTTNMYESQWCNLMQLSYLKYWWIRNDAWRRWYMEMIYWLCIHSIPALHPYFILRVKRVFRVYEDEVEYWWGEKLFEHDWYLIFNTTRVSYDHILIRAWRNLAGFLAYWMFWMTRLCDKQFGLVLHSQSVHSVLTSQCWQQTHESL